MYRKLTSLIPILMIVFWVTGVAWGQGRNSPMGFVPMHELISRAREDARRDWEAGRIEGRVQAKGREGVVRPASFEKPTGSGVAPAAYHMQEELPYHEPAHEMLEEVTGVPQGGVWGGGFESGFEDGCAGGCGGCGVGCGAGFCGPAVSPAGPGGCDPCGCGQFRCGICFPTFNVCRTFEAFWGAQGFTGPVNQAGTGSFGFHEGANLGVQLPHLFCGQWGAQVGVRGVHSNFSGSNFGSESRNQMFVTAGVFRRVDSGLQMGVVLDYLSEDWHIDSELLQLRGEMSAVMHQAGELGFMFRAGVNDDTIVINDRNRVMRPTDLYAMFYRHRFLPCGDGEARIYAGFSDNSDGLLGGDFRMPLTPSLSLDGGWTYLIPEQPTLAGGTENESWNLFLGLAWRPGARSSRNYYRPLFRVADNGSFLRDLD